MLDAPFGFRSGDSPINTCARSRIVIVKNFPGARCRGLGALQERGGEGVHLHLGLVFTAQGGSEETKPGMKRKVGGKRSESRLCGERDPHRERRSGRIGSQQVQKKDKRSSREKLPGDWTQMRKQELHGAESGAGGREGSTGDDEINVCSVLR